MGYMCDFVRPQSRVAVRSAGGFGVIDQGIFWFSGADKILLARRYRNDEGEMFPLRQFLGSRKFERGFFLTRAVHC